MLRTHWRVSERRGALRRSDPTLHSSSLTRRIPSLSLSWWRSGSPEFLRRVGVHEGTTLTARGAVELGFLPVRKSRMQLERAANARLGFMLRPAPRSHDSKPREGSVRRVRELHPEAETGVGSSNAEGCSLKGVGRRKNVGGAETRAREDAAFSVKKH